MATLELLKLLLREHFADPFAESVEKGEDYGLVEPVMIDADICGWVLTMVVFGATIVPVYEPLAMSYGIKWQRSRSMRAHN